MKDIELLHYFLGLEVWQRPGEIFFGHRKYTVEILLGFGMMDCKSMATVYTHGGQSEEGS